MKSVLNLILGIVIGILIHIGISYLCDSTYNKSCQSITNSSYLDVIDSLEAENFNLKVMYDSIKIVQIDRLKDTIKIKQKYFVYEKNINYISTDSLVSIALIGTETLLPK